MKARRPAKESRGDRPAGTAASTSRPPQGPSETAVPRDRDAPRSGGKASATRANAGTPPLPDADRVNRGEDVCHNRSPAYESPNLLDYDRLPSRIPEALDEEYLTQLFNTLSDASNEIVLRTHRAVRSNLPIERKPGGRKRASLQTEKTAAKEHHEDVSLKLPFPDDPGWTRVNWPRLTADIARKIQFSDYSMQSRLAMGFLPFLSASWNCYLNGAAGAFLDVAAALHEFNLTYPKAIQQRWEQIFCAASGSGPRFRGKRQAAFDAHRRELKEQQTAFAAHRQALIQRLRYECVMRVLSGDESLSGQGISLTNNLYYRRCIVVVSCVRCQMRAFDRDTPSCGPGQLREDACDCGRRQAVLDSGSRRAAVTKAAGHVSGLLLSFSRRFFSAESAITAAKDAVYKDYKKCDDLWCGYLSELDEKPLFTPKSWPGKFYLPSRKVCESLGWSDLSRAYASLRVPPDDPLERSGLGLWLSEFGAE